MERRGNKTPEKQLVRRKLEKWSEIVAKLPLDLNRPSNIVTAKSIKDTVNEEPRLMTKIDQEEYLPSIFKKYGVFILPLDRHTYAILKGKGYHALEPIESSPKKYLTHLPFPTSARGSETESTYLTYAYSTGLLGHFASVDDLRIVNYSRRNTPAFDCYVSGIHLKNIRAQIEVDGVYENKEQIVLVEAKRGIPTSFNIRQLYYPYRTHYSDSSDSKSVRNIFFCYDNSEDAYLLYEYDFEYHKQYDSIRFVKGGKYAVVFKPEPIKKYQVSRDNQKFKIPQADDLNRIIAFPFLVAEGIDTAEKIAQYFHFTKRQSSYYREAVEILGLVESRGNRYHLTNIGEEYIKQPTVPRLQYMCKLLLEFPVINLIFLNLSTGQDKLVTKNGIAEILRENSNLRGTTLMRRAQTILKWFSWIQHNVGLVEVHKDKIRLSRQLKLEF